MQNLWGVCTQGPQNISARKTFGVSHTLSSGASRTQNFWDVSATRVFGASLQPKTFGVSLQPGPSEHFCTRNFWGVSCTQGHWIISPQKPLVCLCSQGHRSISAPKVFEATLHPKLSGCLYTQGLWSISAPKTFSVSHALGSGASHPQAELQGHPPRCCVRGESLSPTTGKTLTHLLPEGWRTIPHHHLPVPPTTPLILLLQGHSPALGCPGCWAGGKFLRDRSERSRRRDGGLRDRPM